MIATDGSEEKFGLLMFTQASITHTHTIRTRLDSLLRRRMRLGFCRIDQLEVADIFSAAVDDFYSRIKSNSLHVLQPYLPDDNEIPYQLRARSHTLALILT